MAVVEVDSETTPLAVDVEMPVEVVLNEDVVRLVLDVPLAVLTDVVVPEVDSVKLVELLLVLIVLDPL
jgi:hypothetical protein